jgi:hypothetical protein
VLGGAGRGGKVIVAVAEDAAAEEAVPTDAGAGAGLNSTPQCTQNLAVGWFSLPQAAHFIALVSKGISGSGFQGRSPARAMALRVVNDGLRSRRALLWTDHRRPATAGRALRSLSSRPRC